MKHSRTAPQKPKYEGRPKRWASTGDLQMTSGLQWSLFSDNRSVSTDRRIDEINCHQHSIRSAFVFCKQCCVMLCAECKRMGHLWHPLVDILTGFQHQKDQLQGQLEKLKKRLHDLSATCEQLQSLAKVKQSAFNDAKASILERSKKIIKYVREQEKELLKNLDRKFTEDRQKVELSLLKASRFLTDVTNTYITVKNALETNSTINIAKANNDLNQSVKAVLARTSKNLTYELTNTIVCHVNRKKGSILGFVTEQPLNEELVISENLTNFWKNQVLQNNETSSMIKLELISKHNIAEPHIDDDMEKFEHDDQIQDPDEFFIDDIYHEDDHIYEIIPAHFTCQTKTISANFVTFFPNDQILLASSDTSNLHIISSNGQKERVISHLHIKPQGLAMTRDGYIAIPDASDSCIHIYTRGGSLVCKFGRGYFTNPQSIATTSKDTFVVVDKLESGQYEVVLYDPMTGVKSVVGQGDEHAPQTKHPHSVCVDAQDNILLSDSARHCIIKYNKHGRYLFHFGCHGHKDSHMIRPNGLTTDTQGNIIICDSGNNRVSKFSHQGTFLTHLLGNAQQSELLSPSGVSLNQTGILAVTSKSSVYIYKLF